MGTPKVNAAGLKPVLLKKAEAEGIDVYDSNYKFTLWSENGTQGFSYEDHASQDSEIAQKAGICVFRGKSRTAVLEVDGSGAGGAKLYLYTVEIG